VNDYAALILSDPTLLSIGGNTNGMNSFAGLDIGDITGGVYNSHNLLQGDSFACFCESLIVSQAKGTKADVIADYRLLQVSLESKLPSAVGAGLISWEALSEKCLTRSSANSLKAPAEWRVVQRLPVKISMVSPSTALCAINQAQPFE
jgi:hypothetical protein